MAHDTLNILHCSFLLGQCRNGSADDLEGQLRQVEIASKLVEHSLAKVVGVQEASNFVSEDEVVRRQEGRPRLVLRRSLTSLFFALDKPRLQIVGEVFRDVNKSETFLRLTQSRMLPL